MTDSEFRKILAESGFFQWSYKLDSSWIHSKSFTAIQVMVESNGTILVSVGWKDNALYSKRTEKRMNFETTSGDAFKKFIGNVLTADAELKRRWVSLWSFWDTMVASDFSNCMENVNQQG